MLIFSPNGNDRLLLEHIRSEIIFILSIEGSATSTTFLPIELGDNKLIEDNDICGSSLLGFTWMIFKDASTSKEPITMLTSSVEEHPTPSLRSTFQKPSSGL